MKKTVLLAAAGLASLLTGCVAVPVEPVPVYYGPPMPPPVVVVRPYGYYGGYYGYHRGYWGRPYRRW